jgi:hypothetical protein
MLLQKQGIGYEKEQPISMSESHVTKLPRGKGRHGKKLPGFTQAVEGIPSQKGASGRLTPAARSSQRWEESRWGQGWKLRAMGRG